MWAEINQVSPLCPLFSPHPHLRLQGFGHVGAKFVGDRPQLGAQFGDVFSDQAGRCFRFEPGAQDVDPYRGGTLGGVDNLGAGQGLAFGDGVF